MKNLIRESTFETCVDLTIHINSGTQGLAEKFLVERLPMGEKMLGAWSTSTTYLLLHPALITGKYAKAQRKAEYLG